MITYDFTVDSKRFNKRIKSDLQHKLRVALQCYTILNFILYEDNSFTFNAKFKDYRSGIKFIMKNKEGNYKIYNGKYTHELFEPGIVKVTIIVEFEKMK